MAPPFEGSHIDMMSSGETLTMSGSETGGFSYVVSDGREGSCELAVTFSIETNATSFTAITNGTICGLDASSVETLGT